MIYNALSIAGSDPSGGAGIQADLKAFSAQQVYGMAAITALTAQNTTGVSSLHTLPPEFVAEQIRMVFADIAVGAVKIGMIANAEIAKTVSESLCSWPSVPVVLDPVMIAKGGASLLADDAVKSLKQNLVPLADLLTPNLPEAAALLEGDVAKSREDMLEQAERLLAIGPKAVYLKGGHFGGADSTDLLFSPLGAQWFEAKRIQTKNTHGTGCSLSASIAANYARGMTLEDACAAAKQFINQAISNADRLAVGKGYGPIHHFYALWGK